jgi:hypothetical protein
MVEPTLTAHARVKARGSCRTEYFLGLNYFELEDNYGALPADGRGRPDAQGGVATRALTTRSGADANSWCASSCVGADIRESSDDVAGRHFPYLVTPRTSAVAEW